MPPDSASPIEAFLRGTELFFKQSSDEIGKAIEKVLSPEKKEPDSDTPRSRRFEAIEEPDIDVVDRSTKAEQHNRMPETAFTQLERRERQEVADRAMDLEMKALRESLSPAGSTEADAQAAVTKAMAEVMAEAVAAEAVSNAVAAHERQAHAIAVQGAIKAMEAGRKQQLLDSTDEFSLEAASAAKERTARLAAREEAAAREVAAATEVAAPPEEKATASQAPSTLCPSPDRRTLLELIQRSAECSARHDDPYYDVAAQLSRYHPSAAAEAAAELALAQKRWKEEAMAGKRRYLSTGEVVSIKTEKEAILDVLLQRKREDAEVRDIVIETASTNEVTHGLLRAGPSGLLPAKLTAQQEFDLKKAKKRAEEEPRTAADADHPSPQGASAEAFGEAPRLNDDDASVTFLVREARHEPRLNDDDASVTFRVREARHEPRLDDDASEDQEHDAEKMLNGALEAGVAEEDPAWLQDATLQLEDDETLQLVQLEDDEEVLASPADASVSVDVHVDEERTWLADAEPNVRTDEEPTWLADAETILFETPSPRASFGSLLSEATSSSSPRRRRSFQALPLATEEQAPSGGGTGDGGVHGAASNGSFEGQSGAVSGAVSDSSGESAESGAESGAENGSARRPSSSSRARCGAAGAVLGTAWGGPARRLSVVLSGSLVRGSLRAVVGEGDDVLEPEPSAVYARVSGHRSLAHPITSGLAPVGLDGGAPARASDEAMVDRTCEPVEALEVDAASLRARLVGLFVLLTLLAFVLLAWLVDGFGVSVAVLLDVLRATVPMAIGQRASTATSTDADDVDEVACAVDIEDCESMKLAPAQALPPSLTPSPAQLSPWLGRRLWRLTCLTFMLGLLLERLTIEARRVRRLIRGMPHGVGGGSSPSALQAYDLSLLGGLVERLPLLKDLLADGALEGGAKVLACSLAVAAARAEFT